MICCRLDEDTAQKHQFFRDFDAVVMAGEQHLEVGREDKLVNVAEDDVEQDEQPEDGQKGMGIELSHSNFLLAAVRPVGMWPSVRACWRSSRAICASRRHDGSEPPRPRY